MDIKRSHWLIFSLISFLSIFIWWKLSYPQLAVVNFSVNRTQAQHIAKDYIQSLKLTDLSQYKSASVYEFDSTANRYLQKTLGFDNLKTFIETYDYDLFFWVIRFYKENTKEEFMVVVSASTGEIISYKHIIDETAARENKEREEELTKGITFLSQKFHFDPDQYILKGDVKNKLDNRTDYVFSWHHKDVNIPWSPDEKDGSAKLSTSVTLSGNEVLSFSKGHLDIPDPFNRSLQRIKNVGQNILSVIRILYFALFVIAIYYIIARRNHLAMHSSKKFYIGLIAATFIFNILADINEFQLILFKYPTTTPFDDYIWRYWIENLRESLLFSVAIIVPALAGELLRYEIFPNKKVSSFVYYLHTTFLSRDVSKRIFLGYLLFPMMLALQASIFAVGQKYFNVWTEHSWANNLSTAYWPFISAFIIGFNASVFEELFYRMFALSWAKKILKNSILSVVVMGFFWGLAHTGYSVFPMWFRGLEVGMLGLLMGFMFLRFGIIPVIVAHFLFNVFWNSAGFLLGKTLPFYFYSTIGVLILPLIWALIAFILNKKVIEKPMTWNLTKAQLYNLEILQSYLRTHPELISHQSKEQVIQEIAKNGWDIAVVEKAVENVYGK